MLGEKCNFTRNRFAMQLPSRIHPGLTYSLDSRLRSMYSRSYVHRAPLRLKSPSAGERGPASRSYPVRLPSRRAENNAAQRSHQFALRWSNPSSACTANSLQILHRRMLVSPAHAVRRYTVDDAWYPSGHAVELSGRCMRSERDAGRFRATGAVHRLRPPGQSWLQRTVTLDGRGRNSPAPTVTVPPNRAGAIARRS